MLYVVYCKDKPGMFETRKATRAAHLAYIEETGAVVFSGPLQSDDRQMMIGSMLVIKAENRAEAEAWAANDPYAKAGMFASTEVTPFVKVIG